MTSSIDSNFHTHKPKNVIVPTKRNVLESFIDLMKQYKDDVEIQRYACLALEKLTRNPDYNSIINSYSKIDTIINAMKNHQNDVKVQRYGFRAFRRLSTNLENTIFINSVNEIEPIVTLMRDHQDDIDVQRCGFRVLKKIACHKMENNNGPNSALMNSRNVKAIDTLMRKHQVNLLFSHNTFQFLLNWWTSDRSQETFSERCLEILRSLINHGGTEGSFNLGGLFNPDPRDDNSCVLAMILEEIGESNVERP